MTREQRERALRIKGQGCTIAGLRRRGVSSRVSDGECIDALYKAVMRCGFTPFVAPNTTAVYELEAIKILREGGKE